MVGEWISSYLARLRARFAPGDWPEPGSAEFAEFVKGWVKALALKQVSAPEALAAADRLTLNPPNFRREWIPRVVAEVEAARRSVPSPLPVFNPRHSAWDAAAAALWDQTPEDDRERWRDLVRERLPEFRQPRWVEGLAIGWCYDPSLVAGEAPRAVPVAKDEKQAVAGWQGP